MSSRADKLVINALTDTHTQTDAGNDNTQRPKLALGEKNTTTDNYFQCSDGITVSSNIDIYAN